MRLVELDRISDGDLQQVIAGEPEPWGRAGESLSWREKSHNLGLRDDAGNLVALAGLLLAEVRVADATLQVAGIGGVIVTRSARGRGLARVLIERLLQLAPELGAELAMLFCLPANVALYAKFGFEPIEEPVWAAQPDGSVEMPLPAMWKPLTPAARWPAGRVELLGEPF
jgi:predicted N-acetyltransferase YhbS